MPQKEINWKLNLVIIAIAQFLAMVGTGCCQPFIPLFIRENLGIVDEQLRGVYVSLYFMAGMIALTLAYPFWGRLADRFGRKRMLLRASYAATFTYPLMYFAPNIWVLLLIRLISCFLAGTVVPARTLLVTTSPKEKHGMILGTLLAVMECGHVAGYLVGGLLVHYFGYFTSFMACGSVYLTSALLVHIFTRENFVPMVKEKAE
ncbi:MAG: MFS transporter, partial [Lentisphaeria bacterium]|nr:MFS transporter [Lentisphaeria bacterium]